VIARTAFGRAAQLIRRLLRRGNTRWICEADLFWKSICESFSTLWITAISERFFNDEFATAFYYA